MLQYVNQILVLNYWFILYVMTQKQDNAPV